MEKTAHAELDLRTRLRMLVTLRSIEKDTKKAGYISTENVHTLNSIGFSVITWVYDSKGGTLSVEDCRRHAEGGNVTYGQLKDIIQTYTMDYTVAPWGGPLSEVEIYGAYTPKTRKVDILYQACAATAISVFILLALGWAEPIFAVLAWLAIAILTITTLLVKGVLKP